MKRLTLPFIGALLAGAAIAQPATMQSPAYQECTTLAATKPDQALIKADAWLKIDSGVAAYHCRAMALFGQHRYAEAGDALITAHSSIPPEDVTVRSYVTRQAVQAYLNANSVDKALTALNTQISEIGDVRGDNANAAKHTSNLLLDRARIHVTYGKLNDAARDLDHAVSLTPVSEEVLLERASVFETIGDAQLARNDLDAVLTINPNNTIAKQAQARLGIKATATARPLANVPEKVTAAVANTTPAPTEGTPPAPTTPTTANNEPAALPAQHISKKTMAPVAKNPAPTANKPVLPVAASTAVAPLAPAPPSTITPPALPAPSVIAKP